MVCTTKVEKLNKIISLPKPRRKQNKISVYPKNIALLNFCYTFGFNKITIISWII